MRELRPSMEAIALFEPSMPSLWRRRPGLRPANKSTNEKPRRGNDYWALKAASSRLEGCRTATGRREAACAYFLPILIVMTSHLKFSRRGVRRKADDFCRYRRRKFRRIPGINSATCSRCCACRELSVPSSEILNVLSTRYADLCCVSS